MSSGRRIIIIGGSGSIPRLTRDLFAGIGGNVEFLRALDESSVSVTMELSLSDRPISKEPPFWSADYRNRRNRS